MMLIKTTEVVSNVSKTDLKYPNKPSPDIANGINSRDHQDKLWYDESSDSSEVDDNPAGIQKSSSAARRFA